MADHLGAFEQAVLLTVLNLGSGAYGRAIIRDLPLALNRGVSAGAAYTTLDRLEQKGLLQSRLEAGTAVRGGRERRYYSVTASGITMLNASKDAMERLWRGFSWPLGSST